MSPVDTSQSSAERFESPLEFETLIADLSSGFVNLPAVDVDARIEEAQRRVCEFLGVDRSVLWQRSITAVLLTSGVWTPTAAQVPSDKWDVTVAPYFMGAAMSGTTAVRGREVEVDVSASDIFSNLQFGAMGLVVARKGKWGLAGSSSPATSRWKPDTAGSTWTTRRATETSGSSTTC